jgi:hypothetical protein
MAIRNWDAKGGYWRLQVLFGLLAEAMQRWSVEATSSSQYCTTCLLPTPHSNTFAAANDEFLGEWQLFLDYLQELDVINAPSLKRIIDGTQLAKALGVKPGKWMAKAMEVCVAWQLRHPNVTDPAGAVEEVSSRREELEIPSR